MKKVLILGVGNAQIDAIEYFKEKGYEVHGCSYSHGDNGEKYLDRFALINIVDIEGIKQYINKENIDIVYSVGSDLAMPSVSKAAEDLGLKHFVSSETARICNTKNVLRQYLGENFEGNIPFQVISSQDDAILLEYPFIMKPVDSQGQRGVYKINNYREFKEKISSSLSFSKSGKVIIEEFIDGDEISVNTFSVNGKIIFNIISDRIVWNEFPGGIIHKHVIPSKYGIGEVKKKIENLVERVLNKLTIDDGPAYFQIKIKNGSEPILVEVTPRLDGCHMWKLIKYYCNVNLLDMSIKHLLGELDKQGIIEINPKKESVVLEFMCQPTGSNVSRDNFNISWSDYHRWYYKNGEVVKKMNGYMEKCGYEIGEYL